MVLQDESKSDSGWVQDKPEAAQSPPAPLLHQLPAPNDSRVCLRVPRTHLHAPKQVYLSGRDHMNNRTLQGRDTVIYTQTDPNRPRVPWTHIHLPKQVYLLPNVAFFKSTRRKTLTIEYQPSHIWPFV